MSKILTVSFLIFGSLMLLISVMLFGLRGASASAPSGLPAVVATSSSLTIGPTLALNTYAFGTSTSAEKITQCSARIITTTNSAIMLAFSSAASTTLSGGIGHWQAASTTVAYDSGQYGCGYVTVFAYATTTISLTETR